MLETNPTRNDTKKFAHSFVTTSQLHFTCQLHNRLPEQHRQSSLADRPYFKIIQLVRKKSLCPLVQVHLQPLTRPPSFLRGQNVLAKNKMKRTGSLSSRTTTARCFFVGDASSCWRSCFDIARKDSRVTKQ